MTVVNKLGGSCLRSTKDYLKIEHIIPSTSSILVVSASYGTTAALLDCLNLASAQKNFKRALNTLIATHVDYNRVLTHQPSIKRRLLKDKQDISSLLDSVSLLGTYSSQQKDWLLGYGEYWSSIIIASMLNWPWLDSGQIITVQAHEGLIIIDWEETKRRLFQFSKELKAPGLVMPGFVARDTKGHRALLGFNGSDYTAAIIAKLIQATDLYKWTDRDGIYTADPQLVKSAFAIDDLSYQEASELAYFGASILHPQSVQPAIEANIPIHIKNFFKTHKQGTTISAASKTSTRVVKGLSSISGVTLINIEGTGLLGLCGVAGRLFHALSKGDISVILISQASSEHSISIAVKEDYGQNAVTLLRFEFGFELEHGIIQDLTLKEHCAVVSAVGDGMSGTPGVAAKFFAMLFKAQINIFAIAQGSSERNISVVIAEPEVQRALQVLHGGFYLSAKTLSIGLIGPGGVGAELLDQIKKNRLKLKNTLKVDLKVRAIMNSKGMLLNHKNTEFQEWKKSLLLQAVPQNMADFITHIASPEIPHAVIVDCTSSAALVSSYPAMLKGGCHIITPNKKANSSSLGTYKKLKECVEIANRHYLYEATVCAGLPVIKTIQDLIATGDTIKRIEGIVSGTLSFIFHHCAQGFSFADSVIKAYELGYTEPDPRDDLNGMDVARKFVCLARELGYEASLEDITLLNMVPEALREVSIADFLKKLPEHQQKIEQRIKKLLAANASIAYVGVIENGVIRIQLQGYPASHPFAHTQGTDNVLLIQSSRYDKQPLIIQGPGAGKDVTAAGVFADLLKLAAML